MAQRGRHLRKGTGWKLTKGGKPLSAKLVMRMRVSDGIVLAMFRVRIPRGTQGTR